MVWAKFKNDLVFCFVLFDRMTEMGGKSEFDFASFAFQSLWPSDQMVSMIIVAIYLFK